MSKCLCFGLLFTFVLGLPFFSEAAADDFVVKVLAGEDTTPPTTPVLLSVSPIAPTQIDIDWSVSTDNFLFGGYVLLRNGVPLATTTLTSYSDIGLTSETLYTYEVYAFDSAGNISTTSNSLSTSTPSVPPPNVPEQENGSQSTQTLVLRDFSIETTTNTATLFWDTSLPSRYSIRWGRTDAYNDGYVFSEVYLRKQQTTITDLEPGTVYRFELVAYTPTNRAVVLRSGEFTTTLPPVPLQVPNVTRLVATVNQNDVTLRYALPAVPETATVRVMRSHLNYPATIQDGALVYEGRAEEVFDAAALANYSTQYYTVFLLQSDGSVSSGAVVVAERAKASEGENSATDPVTSVPNPVEETEPEVLWFGLDASAITLIQRGITVSFITENITLSHTEPFTISIPYEAVPPYLKAIIVTLLDPTDQRRSYSFLLRINSDGTAYEATIAPLQVVGLSRLQVEIYDFERLLVGRYRVPITFALQENITPEVFFPDALVAPLTVAAPYIFSLIAFFSGLLFLIWWRSRKTEDKP